MIIKSKTSKVPDGRKYRLAIISLLIVLAGFGLAALNPVLATVLPELITGVLGINIVYNGGNVGNKLVTKKKNKNLPPSE